MDRKGSRKAPFFVVTISRCSVYLKMTKTVLLVEDESTFQMIGKIMLRSIGHPPENFYSALSGSAAIALLDKLVAEGKALPDIILLDVYMPDMDGFGFLEAYSKKDYPNKEQITIIGLSSSHDPKDVARMQQYGVTKYMTKPLEEEKIRAELGI